MNQEKSAIKKIRATGAMREVMAEYFGELDEASRTGSKKVAWCTSVGPAELLRSFGFLVYFPENHGALLGSSRMAADLIPAATAAGYSPEICSYLTSDVGSYLSKSTPLTHAFGMESVPKPDVLVYNTNQCRDVQDWFAFYQREWEVPMLGIQTPRSVDELDAAIVDGLVQQHKDLIPHLEEISGRNFDIDRLREVVASSHRCTLLWRQGPPAGRAPALADHLLRRHDPHGPGGGAARRRARRALLRGAGGRARGADRRGRGSGRRREAPLLLGGHAGLGQAA